AGYLSALRYHSLENCRQFLDAQKYYYAPTENMICGDAEGNIAWQASAASPKRPNWHGRLPVPGTGEFEWDGLRQDLPRELNPERGWIATANHDIHPRGYDPPLFFKNTPQDNRYRRIAQVFSTGEKFSIRHMQALQHDALNTAFGQNGMLFRNWTSANPRIERARRALSEWDGQHRRESLAAAIYRFIAPGITAEVGEGAPPENQRRVLEPRIAAGLDSLRARLGPDESQWRWGRFNTSELPHSLVKAYDIPPVERHGGGGFVAAVGATYREIIDMNDLDASVATNLPGQSGQPESPFYKNLAESFGRAEYFPLVFSRPAVERAAAHRLILVPQR
ncbi:MAG: penicillin acylase family protein, partial [Gemmatimonadaceae bacterium]